MRQKKAKIKKSPSTKEDVLKEVQSLAHLVKLSAAVFLSLILLLVLFWVFV